MPTILLVLQFFVVEIPNENIRGTRHHAHLEWGHVQLHPSAGGRRLHFNCLSIVDHRQLTMFNHLFYFRNISNPCVKGISYRVLFINEAYSVQLEGFQSFCAIIWAIVNWLINRRSKTSVQLLGVVGSHVPMERMFMRHCPLELQAGSMTLGMVGMWKNISRPAAG